MTLERKSASTIYQTAPPRMAFILEEGAWTDSDLYKAGGYFAAPMDRGMFVQLGTINGSVTKSTTASSPVIGQLISEPMSGVHSENGRHGTVELFGSHVLELEIKTTSDTIAMGGYVIYAGAGGYFGDGIWTKGTTSNGTCALNAYTTGSGTASTIPVLFNARGL